MLNDSDAPPRGALSKNSIIDNTYNNKTTTNNNNNDNDNNNNNNNNNALPPIRIIIRCHIKVAL